MFNFLALPLPSIGKLLKGHENMEVKYSYASLLQQGPKFR